MKSFDEFINDHDKLNESDLTTIVAQSLSHIYDYYDMLTVHMNAATNNKLNAKDIMTMMKDYSSAVVKVEAKENSIVIKSKSRKIMNDIKSKLKELDIIYDK